MLLLNLKTKVQTAILNSNTTKKDGQISTLLRKRYKKGLSHLVRPKKSEKVLKKTIFTAKSVNETEKVEFLRNSTEIMDFFYRRFLPLDVFNTSSGRKTTLLPQI